MLFRVPPPIVRPPGKGIPGQEILAEFPPEPGVLLWKSFRNAELWSRGGGRKLFSEGAFELREELLRSTPGVEELKRPLGVVAGALKNRPGLEPAELSGACGQISAWAEERGKLRTALCFMQAAALADPDDASAAVSVGRLARMQARYPQAETWFEHAIVLARAGKDWQAYAEAYAGLGNLHFQMGRYGKARAHHRRCLRTARRHTLHAMQGAAHHNLCRIAVETGDHGEVEEHASQALACYPATHHGVRRLAQDVAYYWITEGLYANALRVLDELAGHLPSPPDRAAALAGIVRAQGGLNDVDGFETAWARAWLLLAEGSAGEQEAAILLDMAYGALYIGETTRAERTAERAARLAAERHETKVRAEAEALARVVKDPAEPRPTPRTAELPSEELAEKLIAVLRQTRTAAA